MPDILANELEAFERQKDDLLGKAEGKFALVRDDEVAGVFDSKEDAIEEGYKQFGNIPFLVKQIVRVETPQNYISFLLGI